MTKADKGVDYIHVRIYAPGNISHRLLGREEFFRSALSKINDFLNQNFILNSILKSLIPDSGRKKDSISI